MAKIYVVSELATVGVCPRVVGVFNSKKEAEAALDAQEIIFEGVKFEITESELDENSQIYKRIMGK